MASEMSSRGALSSLNKIGKLASHAEAQGDATTDLRNQGQASQANSQAGSMIPADHKSLVLGLKHKRTLSEADMDEMAHLRSALLIARGGRYEAGSNSFVGGADHSAADAEGQLNVNYFGSSASGQSDVLSTSYGHGGVTHARRMPAGSTSGSTTHKTMSASAGTESRSHDGAFPLHSNRAGGATSMRGGSSTASGHSNGSRGGTSGQGAEGGSGHSSSTNGGEAGARPSSDDNTPLSSDGGSDNSQQQVTRGRRGSVQPSGDNCTA